MNLGVLPELVQEVPGFGIEVAVRHGGVSFPLTVQKPADVPAIFLQQGAVEIFRMTLEMNEEAVLFLFDEEVDSRVGGPGEDGIAVFIEALFANFIPA